MTELLKKVALVIVNLLLVIIGAALWYCSANQARLDVKIMLNGISVSIDIVRDAKGFLASTRKLLRIPTSYSSSFTCRLAWDNRLMQSPNTA